MLVIIEGCDGSGKSTFAEKIADVFREIGISPQLWHRAKPVRHTLEEYELDVEKNYDRVTAYNTAIICDRFHLGEWVYGPLFRGKSQLSLGDIWHVNAFLQSRGALQIIMTQPSDIIRKRLVIRGEELLRLDEVDIVTSAYDGLVGYFKHSVQRITGEPTQLDAAHVACESFTAAERVRRLAAFPTYVGPPDPEIVLLGERRQLSDARPVHESAFVPYPGTSGHWLCDAIVNSPLFERKIGLANACEENVSSLVRTLGFPRVVALGRKASIECASSYVDHGQVPHPQYGRRFHHRGSYEYACAIETAADRHRKVNPAW